MKVLREQVEELAESFRVNLELDPWDEFEKKSLDRWEAKQAFTAEIKELYKKTKRQCGKSTKLLLLRIAEAYLTKKPLLVCGSSVAHTRALINRAERLIHQLDLDVLVERYPRQVVVLYESLILEV